MHRRLFNATAAAAIAVGVGACSSPPASPSPGTLPSGTAKVTINDKDLPATTAVKCAPIGPITTITAGDAAAGITALISNETGLSAKSININNLGDFTGSSMEGLDEQADVTMTGNMYTIRGTVHGFAAHKPSVRTTATFAVRVAC